MPVTHEQALAEQATGCVQRGPSIGKLYAGPINRDGHVSDPGTELTPVEAMDYMLEGGSVGVPNAGAGSYTEFFRSVGFQSVEVIDQCSSAGDWSFGVLLNDTWYPASQSNRYPYHGFCYGVDFDTRAPTFEILCDVLRELCS